MARAIGNEFLRQHRFAVSFNLGDPLAFSRIEIAPTRELFGPGMVVTKAALSPMLADALSDKKICTVEVSAYSLNESIQDDPPVLVFKLHGVRPKACRSDHIIFAAASSDIVEITPIFDYQRLEIVKGDRSVFEPRPRVRAQAPVIM